VQVIVHVGDIVEETVFDDERAAVNIAVDVDVEVRVETAVFICIGEDVAVRVAVFNGMFSKVFVWVTVLDAAIIGVKVPVLLAAA
jgi:hypothetical protein